MTAVVRGPWAREATMTARQVLAKVRAEVPAVAWDPLNEGIHTTPGLEDVMGTVRWPRGTVRIQVMDHDVEVVAERGYSGRAGTGRMTVRLAGKAESASAIVVEALALCGEVTK